MNVYRNAKTTLKSRDLIVKRYASGWNQQDIADGMGISRRTACKWISRYKLDGNEGLQDRSSRPHRSPNKLAENCERAILQLRREFGMTARTIAKILSIARSTVSHILKYYGWNRLENFNKKEPVIRYEREKPGDMIHIDIKKLGKIDGVGHRINGDRKNRKGSGWEYLHIEVWRVMTDNGSGYISKLYAKIMRLLQLKHKRTRPYTPKTNGKAERFIQTCLREWAYARAYESSENRTRQLAVFIDFYNDFREHAGIKYQTPISRVICE